MIDGVTISPRKRLFCFGDVLDGAYRWRRVFDATNIATGGGKVSVDVEKAVAA